MKTILILALLGMAQAGENYINSIYLGEMPMDGKYPGPGTIAVQICEDGTVIAFKGVAVPGMHDGTGKQVYIKRIQIK